MGLKSIFNKILTNKYILYIVAFLSLVNMFGYLMAQNNQALILFIVFVLGINYFSKNMTVVLFVSLILVNIISASNFRFIELEGYENANTDDGEEKKVNSSTKQDSKEKENPVGTTESTSKNGEKSKSSYVDTASTIKDSYGDLKKMIGEGGIQGLTTDTKELINQQKELFQAMQNMQPLIDGIKPMISMLGGMDGLKGILKGGGTTPPPQATLS